MKRLSVIAFLFSLIFCGCEKDCLIRNFNALSNFKLINDTLVLPLDLSDAVTKGIVIPTKQQIKDGYFKFSFEIKNTSKISQVYSFKILYQNESYKFQECLETGDHNMYNP